MAALGVLAFVLASAALLGHRLRRRRVRRGVLNRNRNPKNGLQLQQQRALCPGAAQNRPVNWLRKKLDAAGLNWSVAGTVKVWAACVFVGFLAGQTASSTRIGVAGALLGATAPLITLRLLNRRGEQVILNSLPGFLERVAHSLRADVSALAALSEAHQDARSPLREEIGGVLAEVEAGNSLHVALDRWRSRRDRSAVNLAVAALSIGAAAGGRRAQAVDGVAATLRNARDSRRELAAQSLQARLSALIIVLLPLAFLALDLLIGGDTLSFLFGSPLGLVCLAAGVGLDVAAYVWIRRIAREP